MDEKIYELLSAISSDLATLKHEVSDVKSDVREIKLHLENVTDKNIATVAESVSSLNNRMIAVQNDVTVLKDELIINEVVDEVRGKFKIG